jgi:oligoribonuclease
MNELFLFLDLETTGLDPTRCKIIEVACVITGSDFVPRAAFESVIPESVDPQNGIWEHVAWQMHRKSGLLDLVSEARVRGSFEARPDRKLFLFLSQHLEARRANLAGNSVHFDRSFLAHQWPHMMSFLTHRHLDVSSIRLAHMAQGKPKFEAGEAPHRAMADVTHSLVELRHWMGLEVAA